ncbi:MAG: hypothetical protein B7Z68_13015 [Acidobacteria bacterium 21-70-11]|nr:MAG: hypothetical protein B7Z68_13015 [Acidobacteria bacterium 21-70-11]
MSQAATGFKGGGECPRRRAVLRRQRAGAVGYRRARRRRDRTRPEGCEERWHEKRCPNRSPDERRGRAACARGGAGIPRADQDPPHRPRRCDDGGWVPDGRWRPAAGVLTARHALAFGVVVAGAGLAILAAEANTLTAVLGLTVVLVYTLVYTPLKPRSPLCTLAGAVCGAIPPMMGWTATGTPLGFGAWLLAGVLFLWQIPHFLALAWLYRDDYARGGFRMLSVVDASGRSTGQAAVLYSMALLPVGVLAALGGMTGWGFAAGSLVLTGGLVALALALAAKKSDAVARRLFLATLIYLPLLLGLMVADRLPSPQGLAAALQAAGR